MQEFLSHLEELEEAGRPAVLATLVATHRARPRRPGAKLVIDADGATIGSVTLGGCVETRVAEAARGVLDDGCTRLLRVDLSAEEALDLGMGCAATLELLVERVVAVGGAPGSSYPGALVRQRLGAGERVAVITRLDAPHDRMVVLDDTTHGTLGDAARDEIATRLAREAIDGGRSLVVEDNDLGRLFVDVFAPPATVFVFGVGPVTGPLLRIAREIGMRTVLVDPAAERADPHSDDADEVRVGSPARVAQQLAIARDDVVILLAHDYKHELPVLERVLASDAGYIGMLGSRRRGAAVLGALAERGVSEPMLARVHVPAGLELGAESPAEIALAIMAQAMAARSARQGRP